MSRPRSSRQIGVQSCCTIVLFAPILNCGIDCLAGRRHALDYNIGKFLQQLQAHLVDTHKQAYPINILHQDLTSEQKRTLRRKTTCPVMFHKVDLSPHSLPMHLRHMFASIVNETREAHPRGDLFLPELATTTMRGFQQRMRSRFLAGELLLHHPSVRGYQYLLLLDPIHSRISSAFPFDPFARAKALKLAFGFQTQTSEESATLVNSLLSEWINKHEYDGKLLGEAVSLPASLIHGGHARGRRRKQQQTMLQRHRKGASSPSVSGLVFAPSFFMFNLQAFRGNSLYTELYSEVDNRGLFLKGDDQKVALTHSQFLTLVAPFVFSQSDATRNGVVQIDDLPISFPVEDSSPYNL